MASTRPTQFGRIHPPDEAWLARRPPEPILDPGLPIIDTHHHLWERPDHRYLLHEFLADVRTGHNVVATVFIECHAMYRAGGPPELRSLGETEFVTGQGAMSDSGNYGPTRVAAGIVGFADLTLGDRVEPVLEAHIRAGGGRFRGVRHAAAWDADPVIGNSQTACLSTRGRSIRSSATSSTWRGPSPAPTSSWGTWGDRSATGPMRGSATRCSPRGRPG
jgi:L-fuconolactonase